MFHTYNKNLLATFDILTQDLIRENSHFSQLATDIFLWRNHPADQRPYDLVINVCTHGNEVIGLCIANHLLNAIKHHQIKSSLNVVFSLANRQAVLENKRFITKDLNRSFGKNILPDSQGQLSYEERRAKELELIAQNSQAILDIHQTTSDSLSPFFVFKEFAYNFNFFEALNIGIYPIILYKEGKFSKDGDAYSTFAMQNSIPFLTIELGLAGANAPIENYVTTKIQELLSGCDHKQWRTLLHEKLWNKPSVPCYQEYKNIERFTDDDFLIEGLKNLSLIEKNTIFAYQQAKALSEDIDLYALFPKYGVFRKTSSELVRLLKKI